MTSSFSTKPSAQVHRRKKRPDAIYRLRSNINFEVFWRMVWWCVQLRTPAALKAASLIWKQRSCKYTVYIYIYTYVHTYLYTRVISKHNPNPRWCIQLLHFPVPLCHPHFVVRLFASTARSRESAADTASDSCPLRIAASQNQRLSKLLMEDESSHLVKFH